MKPLFIPLKAEHFEAFASGEKKAEYRPYGPRWNERTCWIGRPVTLSYGYGKRRRLSGFVCDFFKTTLSPGTAYDACYGSGRLPAAVICIRMEAM